MRFLRDTHVAIWSLAASERLTESERRLIDDPSNEIYISAISILEIAIKRALGRKSAPPFPSSAAIEGFTASGYALLDVKAAHAAAVETLPQLHGDPFDRLLVAQALTEPMRLLTHDRTLASYGEPVTYLSGGV